MYKHTTLAFKSKVSLFMTRLGATRRDGTAFPSVVPEFAPALFRFLLLNLKFSVQCFVNHCLSFLLFFLFDIELSVVLPYRIIYLFGIFPLFLKLLWHTTYLYTVQIRFLMKIHDHIVFLPLKHKFKRRNIIFLNTTLSELFQNLIEKSQKQRQKLDARYRGQTRT